MNQQNNKENEPYTSYLVVGSGFGFWEHDQFLRLSKDFLHRPSFIYVLSIWIINGIV